MVARAQRVLLMRIAMLAPVAWRTPPREYGPWEQVVSTLTEGLVRRGVDVTLFATGDSVTAATLHAVVPRGYQEDREADAKVVECLHISEAFEHADEFDLIHNHFDFLPLAWSRLTKTPVVTTIHGFSSTRILPVFRKYDEETFYVSISDADRSPGLNYFATAYHGIDLGGFTFQENAGDYLLFFGRIHHDKGAAEAIEIARRSGRRLVMAGIIQDQDYYREKVEPFLDGADVTFVGSVGPPERDKLLGGAYALLHPINFAEPFGLSVVEAMACGTPVIAFRKGSMPEVVVDAQTGFLVDTIEEAAEAVARVPGLSRAACRKHVEDNFAADRMVDRYLDIYQQVLAGSHREDRRPWGRYKVLEESPGYKVKRIEVLPGTRLSLQRHTHRSEHWTVVEGAGLVTRGDRSRTLGSGESIDIGRQVIHRMENRTASPLVFIEVQRGDYLGEDDIERLEDDFDRAAGPHAADLREDARVRAALVELDLADLQLLEAPPIDPEQREPETQGTAA
jgi:mannose-6-phosphate isomerase-like protein (cupin superfamily)